MSIKYLVNIPTRKVIVMFQGKVNGIVFTSASSVRGFFEIMLKDYDKLKLIENLEKVHVVAIGPFTADELKKSVNENKYIVSMKSLNHTGSQFKTQH